MRQPASVDRQAQDRLARPAASTPWSGIATAVLIAALLLLPLAVHDTYILHVTIVIAINVIMAVSMWLLGITGLISFGQAGFMFIGAMTTALLTKNAGWPFWVAMPLS